MFNTNSSEFYVIGENGDELVKTNIVDLNKDGNKIVSFDVFKFIESLREHNFQLQSQLIDISQIFKLVIGKPAREFKYSNHSSFDKILLFFNLYPKDEIPSLIQKITTDVNLLTDDIIVDILKSLRTAYYELLILLKKQNEYERFFSVELNICQILYDREIKGIEISPLNFQNRLDELDKLEYSCQNKLRYNYKIIDGHDNDSVYKALENRNYKYIAKNLNNNNIEHLLKYGSETNELLYLVYNLRKAKRDKSFLFRFGAIGNTRIYPIFDCVGTITSRILVKDPLIQQLRKSSRDIFVPDENKVFIYADFGQFEPGILADKSKDKQLIDLYNKGDVYEGLSINVFGTKSNRKIAKILFLSYMYGMNIASLSMIVNELYPKQIDNVSEKLEKFFTEFNLLIPYKTKLEQELLKNNRIGTSIGNYRVREYVGTNKLKNREKRWLLSQKIQGTASLILKKALIDLNASKEIEFLIPMHDAVLFQVPNSNVEKSRTRIRIAFEEAFKTECPSISPKVNFEQFDK